MRHQRRYYLVFILLAIVSQNATSQSPETFEGTDWIWDQYGFTETSDDFYLQGSIKFHIQWKFWLLFGEPVADFRTAWELGSDVRITSAPFLKHYELPYGGLYLPDHVLQTIRLYNLYFSGGFHDAPTTYSTTPQYPRIVFDAGVLTRPYVTHGSSDSMEDLPKDERKRYDSFNVPGSPNWDEFLCEFPYFDEDSYSVEAQYYDADTAKAIYRNEDVTSLHPLEILHCEYDLTGVKEWLYRLDAQAARQAGESTGVIEQAIDQIKQERDQIDNIIENQKQQIAARPPLPNSSSDNSAGAFPVLDGRGARMNLLLLIDTSGSMKGQKMEAAKKAAMESVEDALGRNLQVAVWDFAGSCSNPIKGRVDLTRSSASLSSFIQSLHASGSTPLYTALEVANRYLQNEYDQTGTPGMIVLLADGNDTCGNRQGALSTLSNGSIIIRHEVIGLGVSDDSDAQRQLSEIADQTQGEYHGNVQSEDLGRVFSSVMAGIELMDMFGQFGASESSDSSRDGNEQNESLSSMSSIMEGW